MAWVLLVAGALLSTGCASTLKVTLTAAPNLNSCGKPAGYPLTYRVLQVTDPSVVTGMSLTQLWGKEAALLGPALLDTKESFVDPGARKLLPVEKVPGAAAIIVVGNYCKPRGTCWYIAQPLSKGKALKLLAGSDCLSIEK
jgi:type VI secretion system VasD/TssJ family lipoprotein